MSIKNIKDGPGTLFKYHTVENEDNEVSFINVSKSFELAVKMGQVPGHSAIDKYGEVSNVDKISPPTDLWEIGGAYIYDADGTAPIVSIISSDNADTQEITIEGLDINRNKVVQNITLTGTTRKSLDTALWRVFRMSNNGSTDIAGIVYCYIGTGGVPTAANTRAIIDNGNGQTLMSIYTIPRGFVGFIYRSEIGLSRKKGAGSAQCSYYSRRFGKVFKVKKRVAVSVSGSSVFQDYRTFPDIVPASTDIRLMVESVDEDDMGLFGTFDILFVDETKFSTAYLQSIGQPGY